MLQLNGVSIKQGFYWNVHSHDVKCFVCQAVNLLEKTLMLDPEVRLTAKDGLSHPYLSEFHDPENEPESPPYDDSFESLELAINEWKSEIMCTRAQMHPK